MSLSEILSSRANPTYKHLRALAEHSRFRRETGHTLLDGTHLLEEALAVGIRPVRLIFQEGFDFSGWTQRLPETPAVIFSRGLFAGLTPVASPVGLLAEIPTPNPREPEGGDAVLIEVVQDPGNLGAILRTAAAAGVRNVYLSRGCAEAWSPKALRGAQGAQFRLRIHEQADLESVSAGFSGQVLAAALRAGDSLFALDLLPGRLHVRQ